MSKAEVVIHIGGVHASDRPVVIKTLLGSCIAVCLHDPLRSVGGMNHFMLPRGQANGVESTRFGVHAMDRLIGATMRLGGDRRRFTAKVFGGAAVLDLKGSTGSVSQENIDFITAFLDAEGIPVLSADVGGTYARRVNFHTGTGRAFVKRVPDGLSRLVVAERARAAVPVEYGDVTLF